MLVLEGIPETVTIDFARNWVKPRVSEKRFKHIEGVAKEARRIAKASGCSAELAELAAWLHDSCKEFKDKELLEMALNLSVPVGPHEESSPHLLHGPVAAATVRKELKIKNEDLLSAIAEHTLGNVPMCRLSQVVFLADCLESSRPKQFTDPIWQALDIDNQVNLEAALVVATDLTLNHLIESGKPIHPRAVEMRNHFLCLARTSRAK